MDRADGTRVGRDAKGSERFERELGDGRRPQEAAWGGAAWPAGESAVDPDWGCHPTDLCALDSGPANQ